MRQNMLNFNSSPAGSQQHPLHESNSDRFFSDRETEKLKREKEAKIKELSTNIKSLSDLPKSEIVDFHEITDLSRAVDIDIDFDALHRGIRQKSDVASLDIGSQDDFFSEEEIEAAIKQQQKEAEKKKEEEILEKLKKKLENFMPEIDREIEEIRAGMEEKPFPMMWDSIEGGHIVIDLDELHKMTNG